jgi:hypothetical protein
MKILEPFAGYKLASGHPMLHFAMFVGSFFVDIDYARTVADDWANDSFYSGFPNATADMLRCFLTLRYAHIAVIVLSFPNLVEGIYKFKLKSIQIEYRDRIEEC